MAADPDQTRPIAAVAARAHAEAIAADLEANPPTAAELATARAAVGILERALATIGAAA